MDEMGGQFHAFAVLLEFQIFLFQVFEIGRFIFQKQIRIIGNRPGGQAQGLDMGNVHEPVNGSGHIFSVHERITAGDHNFLDQRRIFNMGNRRCNALGCGVFFVPGIFMLSETKPAINRTAHVEQKDHPVLVHLFQKSVMELADPGVGVASGLQFFHKGHVLIGHIPGDHHLANGMPGETYRISFNDGLEIGPLGLGNVQVGHFFQLGRIFYGHIPMARDHLFNQGHQEPGRQCYLV